MVSSLDSQSGGPGFESRSGHLLDLFLVVPSSYPRSRLQIANWLPPASWGLQSCYVMLKLFVSKYLSVVPVNYNSWISALSTMNKPLNLFKHLKIHSLMTRTLNCKVLGNC